MAKAAIKYKLGILLGIVTILIIACESLFSTSEAPNVHVIFRYDDYASESSAIVEKQILSAINTYNISCSFGVIPFVPDTSSAFGTNNIPLSPAKIEFIKKQVQDRSIEICQHGFSHTSLVVSETNTEFKGLPLNQQLETIAAAKEFLDTAFRVQTETFIPPWNSYDQSTVEALSRLGFHTISADNNEVIGGDITMNLIPYTVYATDIENITEQHSLPYFKNRLVMVWMLHDYDFQEIDSSAGITNFDDFNALMGRMTEKNWKITSIVEATNELDIFDLHHYKINRLKLSLLNHLTPLLKIPIIFNKLGSLNHFYLGANQVYRLLLITISYYLCLMLIISELVNLTTRKLNVKSMYARIISVATLAIFFAASAKFWFDDHTMGRKEMILLIFIASVFFAFIMQKKYTPSAHRKGNAT